MSEWRVPGFAEESELGRGGSGRVVVAVEESSGRRVAVKYLADRLVADEDFRAAFRGEAEILAGLDLPHVARVRGYVESERGAAIVMDLVGGVSLRRVLGHFGPTGPKAALSVLKGSLLGLAGAHRAGVVHRDYKPENVMVDPSGSSMLVDFGIAARSGSPGRPAGTPGYAAPEQWQGGPASPSGDIYAAAVTFAECVTGAEPPRGYPAPPGDGQASGVTVTAENAQAMGPRLAGLLARASAADPAARPADADALLAELQEAADDRYGAGWEEDGEADLARSVAALLALAAGAAAGAAAAAGGPASPAPAAPAQGPGTSAVTVLGRARRLGRARIGPVPAVVAGAAAAGVIAVAAVAVAVTAGHHPSGPAQAGPGGSPTTTAAASPSHPSRSATPSGTATSPALAVNPADPCTWLTPADFARYGITSGHLAPNTEPGNWRGCKNGEVIVGRRAPAPSAVGCTVLPNCTNISIPGATGGRYLVVPGQGIEVDAFRGGIEYAVAVPSGTANARAALVRLMELVLTRTAAAS